MPKMECPQKIKSWPGLHGVVSFCLVVIVGWVYWIGKSPLSFEGVAIPDLAMVLLSLCAAAGCLFLVVGKWAFTWQELGFGFFLLMVPLFGMVGGQVGIPSSDWEMYVDHTRTGSNGFVATLRPYLFTAILFLLSSRVIAMALTGAALSWAVLLAVVPHMLWGVAQCLYVVFPGLLSALPIRVGEAVEGGFNLHIVRATGLTTNPFYYSFLLLVAAFIADMHGRKKGVAAWLIAFSWLSISRSFVVASVPAFYRSLTSIRMRWRLLILAVALAISVASIEMISSILEMRFSTDVSAESRGSTNMLAIRSLLEGNFFGFGFDVPYYTDSTIAFLLIGGGLPAVVSYVFAWILLFHGLWRSSGRDGAVLAFAFMFFATMFLVGSPESQPGLLLFFVAYWVTRMGQSEAREAEVSRP